MSHKSAYKALQDELHFLSNRAKKKPSLSIKEILGLLPGKGRILVIIFLSLPFCQPFQIPGLSMPFGLLIAFLGLRMSFGQEMWLPKFILKKQISSIKIQKISIVGLKIIRKLKVFLHPRAVWICHHSWMRVVNGLAICFLGLFLALPLPIPLTNLVAAWGGLLIGLGVLEEDGIFVMVGYSFLLITLAILFSIFYFLLREGRSA